MSNDAPMVSVIMPTYNRSRYIIDSINSVLSQSLKDFELIIIDDGSTDETMELVKENTDPRIKYHYIEHSGRSYARNIAIQLAIGKYITFLDSDDLYLHNKLAIQVNILDKEKKYSCVYGAAYSIDGEGNRILGAYNRSDIMQLVPEHTRCKYPYFDLPSGDIYRDVAFFVPLTILLPTVMFRRSVINKVGFFDITLDRFEDTDYWRRASKSEVWYAINEPLCEIRTHKKNELASQSATQILSNLSIYVRKALKDDEQYLKPDGRRLSSGLYLFYGLAFKSQSQNVSGIRLYYFLIFFFKAFLWSPRYVVKYLGSYILDRFFIR